jgi:hypothetical protein
MYDYHGLSMVHIKKPFDDRFTERSFFNHPAGHSGPIASRA